MPTAFTGVLIAIPLQLPLHAGFVVVTFANNAGGLTKFATPLAIQPAASIAVKVYVPAFKFVGFCPTPEATQLKLTVP